MVQEALATLRVPTLVSGALPNLDSELWLGELVEALGGRTTEFQVGAISAPEDSCARRHLSLQPLHIQTAAQLAMVSIVTLLPEACAYCKKKSDQSLSCICCFTGPGARGHAALRNNLS